MHFAKIALFTSISMFATAPVLAQAPQIEKNISMAMALAIIQGTIDQCTKDGYKVSVTIVDKGVMSRHSCAATAPARTRWSSAA